jgi:AraC-like DNA-binding protein
MNRCIPADSAKRISLRARDPEPMAVESRIEFSVVFKAGDPNMQSHGYRIAPFMAQACKTLGIGPVRVLARAGLPADYLTHEGRGLDAATWFAALEALVTEAGSPDRAMELGRALAVGPLHPALIAFSASPDIRTGVQRMALFKPLIAPVTLAIGERDGVLSIMLSSADAAADLPPAVAIMEVSYLLELLRMFASEDIKPQSVTLPAKVRVTDAFRRFAACEVLSGTQTGLALRDADASLPIISADTGVYRLIEQELMARLKSLSDTSGMADRVRREIRNALPSGRVSAEVVAHRLRISTRSLQRKLKAEGASFQAILDETRAALALIYLRDHKLSAEETSFLLAYRDPNSFYRAFNDWTGMTPAEARAATAA